jgi:hypothetical protein
MITAAYAANKVKANLEKSGQVGYIESQRNLAIAPAVISAGQDSASKLQPYADCLVDGAKYIVTINGVEHITTGYYSEDGYFFIGNGNICVENQPDTGESFGMVIRSMDSATRKNRVALSEPVTVDTTIKAEQLVYEIIHTIDPKYLPEGGVGYTEGKETVIYPETKLITYVSGDPFTMADLVLVCGETYNVYLDGGKHTGIAKDAGLALQGTAMDMPYLGNISLAGGGGTNTGEDFLLVFTPSINGTMLIYMPNGVVAGTVTLKVTQGSETIHPIDPKYLPEGGVGYAETEQTMLADKTDVVFSYQSGPKIYQGLFNPNAGVDAHALAVGDMVTVSWDGKEYECEICMSQNTLSFGNLSIMNLGENTGEPFLLGVSGGSNTFGAFTTDTAETHTVGIYQKAEAVVQIDKKFIPPLDSLILNGSDGKQYKVTVANGALAVEVV